MPQAGTTPKSKTAVRIGVPVLVALLLLVPLFVRNPFLIHIMIITALNAVLAMALRLPLITGRYNIGIVSFCAIGAYTSALLAVRLGVNFWVSALAGCALAVLVALGLGLIILRVSGIYFGMLTMCLLEMLRHYLLWHRELTSGVMGVINIPGPSLFGFDFGANKIPYYYLTIVILVFSIWFMVRLEHSRAGMAFHAVGQSDLLSSHLGIHLTRYRLLAFVVSSFFAAVTGCINAHYMHYTSPEDWTIMQSLTIQIYMIVGGRYSPWGPLVGPVALMGISELLRPTKEILPLVYGAILIPVILFFPRGIVGLPQAIFEWWARRRQTQFSASE